MGTLSGFLRFSSPRTLTEQLLRPALDRPGVHLSEPRRVESHHDVFIDEDGRYAASRIVATHGIPAAGALVDIDLAESDPFLTQPTARRFAGRSPIRHVHGYLHLRLRPFQRIFSSATLLLGVSLLSTGFQLPGVFRAERRSLLLPFDIVEIVRCGLDLELCQLGFIGERGLVGSEEKPKRRGDAHHEQDGDTSQYRDLPRASAFPLSPADDAQSVWTDSQTVGFTPGNGGHCLILIVHVFFPMLHGTCAPKYSSLDESCPNADIRWERATQRFPPVVPFFIGEDQPLPPYGVSKQ